MRSIEKRIEKELVDCKNYSVSTIAKEILDVADSIKRCKQTSHEFYKDSQHEVVRAIEET